MEELKCSNKQRRSSALSMSELASIPLFSRAGIEQESLLNALKAFQKFLLLKVFKFVR